MNSNGVGEAGDIAGGIGVVARIALCVSVTTALIVDRAVSITSVGLAVGADMKLLQVASITGARWFDQEGSLRLPRVWTGGWSGAEFFTLWTDMDVFCRIKIKYLISVPQRFSKLL